MRLEPSDIGDLGPIIEMVVCKVMDRMKTDRAKVDGRLGYSEAEAAAMIGLPRHSLRDLRLSGKVKASRLGRRVVYSSETLIKLLRECES